MGWSILPDQRNRQWKILLPKELEESGAKHISHPVGEKLLVTQDFLLEHHKTPRRFFLTFLVAVRFSEWYTSSGLALQSLEVLAQKSNVSRSFISLWSGKVAFSYVMYEDVLRGTAFQ